MAGFLSTVADSEELENRFQRATCEMQVVMESIIDMTKGISDDKADEERSFLVGMLARLLLSSVIEGDRFDTARFLQGMMLVRPAQAFHWNEAVTNVERFLSELPTHGDVNHARAEISRQCLEFANRPNGIYRLNVPTGGGKTLSALRLAVAHCMKHGKRRVFYIAPLISILEQNADVIREALDHEEWVLEHHSN